MNIKIPKLLKKKKKKKKKDLYILKNITYFIFYKS